VPRWTYRQHHRTRIMGMLEGMLQLGRHPNPYPGIALVGSKPPSNNKLRHGRARVAESRISPQGHTGTRVVVLVQVLHPHSLLLGAHSRLEAIMSSAREYATSTSKWMTLAIDSNSSKVLSTNMWRTQHANTTIKMRSLPKPSPC
jgi:hypothetical protein